MQLRFVKISVSDQDKALEFYVGKLGFIAKADIMMGSHRFLTVAAPDGIEGVQLILEPNGFPPASAYQQACYAAGMPVLAINTEDAARDHRRLTGKGVVFRGVPKDLGPIISATFDDTCGNLIHLVQAKQRQG
jgi:catechol 2,3-dioxygenase-like lactoylglutathione lyase family enzyme